MFEAFCRGQAAQAQHIITLPNAKVESSRRRRRFKRDVVQRTSDETSTHLSVPSALSVACWTPTSDTDYPIKPDSHAATHVVRTDESRKTIRPLSVFSVEYVCLACSPPARKTRIMSREICLTVCVCRDPACQAVGELAVIGWDV